jgi:small subunit ribosomal protein S21
MDDRKPQPAWKKKEGQQSSQDRRSGNRGPRKDNRDNRDRNQPLPPLQDQRAPVVGPLEVEVYNDDVGQALKILKNKMSKDGILAELKRRRHAEKPSEAKRRKHREALKRLRKSKGKVRRTGGWKNKSEASESRLGGQKEQPVQKENTPDEQVK